MKNRWNNIQGNLLMADAGGTTDASTAGGGATSFINGTAGGGALSTASGDADTTPPAATNKSAVNDTSSNNAAGSQVTDWRSQLPKELQDDATIKKFSDVSTLAKSYLNAQKLIGADKIAVPTKHTTDEEWTAIHRRLGVPEKNTDYAVKFKEGVSVDQKFSEGFRDLAHKVGVLPKQAQALADWFSDVNMGSEQQVATELKRVYEQNVAGLRQEWGNSFELNVSRANKVVNDIGGKDVAKYMMESGAGADKNVIKFLAKIGEQLYGEHKFVEGQGTSATMDPKEINAEITKIKMNPAYYDKGHPAQKALVGEMTALFEKLHPPKQ